MLKHFYIAILKQLRVVSRHPPHKGVLFFRPHDSRPRVAHRRRTQMCFRPTVLRPLFCSSNPFSHGDSRIACSARDPSLQQGAPRLNLNNQVKANSWQQPVDIVCTEGLLTALSLSHHSPRNQISGHDHRERGSERRNKCFPRELMDPIHETKRTGGRGRAAR